MALIPPFFIDSVVAIGAENIVNTKTEKKWIGTGFLFGKFLSVQADDPTKKSYACYLVTNKHVIEKHERIIIRFNPQNGQSAKDYAIQLKSMPDKKHWAGHPDKGTDVAVLPMNLKTLEDAGMKFGFFKSDMDAFNTATMERLGVGEGDFTYTLGFPMGMMPSDRQHVIVRSGIIARIRDVFEKRSSSFVVDSMVFPGNSGGPVVFKPEAISIQPNAPIKQAALIGIVKSYIQYTDVAISQQTGRPRVIFEENSGLANVETVDKILETIANAESTGKHA
jgi:hypothetical protein